MKRIAIVGAGLLALSMLTGCSDGPVTLNSQVFTPTEVAVYSAYQAQRGYVSYREFYDAVGAMRKWKQPQGDGFFCDAMSSLKAADFKLTAAGRTNVNSLSDVYKSIYGVSPAEACGTPMTRASIVETVRVPQAPQALSPAMYDELIKVASSCGRSKAFLLNLTESKEYLTKADYDAAMQAVMSCKKFELEQSLQK